MDVTFADDDLERLEVDLGFGGSFPQAVIASFRRKMQHIRAAADERDFYAMRSLRYEKLSGARSHQHSMRLNDQYRLIVELREESEVKRVVIVSIEDYH